MNYNGDNTICVWMICLHKLYHFTVANTRFTAPLTRRGKTKFATLNDTIYAGKSFNHKRVIP